MKTLKKEKNSKEKTMKRIILLIAVLVILIPQLVCSVGEVPEWARGEYVWDRIDYENYIYTFIIDSTKLNLRIGRERQSPNDLLMSYSFISAENDVLHFYSPDELEYIDDLFFRQHPSRHGVLEYSFYPPDGKIAVLMGDLSYELVIFNDTDEVLGILKMIQEMDDNEIQNFEKQNNAPPGLVSALLQEIKEIEKSTSKTIIDIINNQDNYFFMNNDMLMEIFVDIDTGRQERRPSEEYGYLQNGRFWNTLEKK